MVTVVFEIHFDISNRRLVKLGELDGQEHGLIAPLHFFDVFDVHIISINHY